jgi:hypothetical protein
VLGTMDEVKKATVEDLVSPVGAYHALFYGEDILLQCWEDGRKVAVIDLHPFITYRVPGCEEDIRFDGEGDKPASLPEGGFGSDEADTEQLLEGGVEIQATVDWDAVKVPVLKGDPLPVGQAAPFEDGDEWAYGLHDEWDCYVD